MKKISAESSLPVKAQRANTPRNPLQAIPWGFKHWSRSFEYSHFIKGLSEK